MRWLDLKKSGQRPQWINSLFWNCLLSLACRRELFHEDFHSSALSKAGQKKLSMDSLPASDSFSGASQQPKHCGVLAAYLSARLGCKYRLQISSVVSARNAFYVDRGIIMYGLAHGDNYLLVTHWMASCTTCICCLVAWLQQMTCYFRPWTTVLFFPQHC